MFNVGDVITGTLENGYGITTRGMVCSVIGTEDCARGCVDIKIIDVDEELLKESRSSYMKHIRNATSYIGGEYTVCEEAFEYYEPKAKFADLFDGLIDFVNSV